MIVVLNPLTLYPLEIAQLKKPGNGPLCLNLLNPAMVRNHKITLHQAFRNTADKDCRCFINPLQKAVSCEIVEAFVKFIKCCVALLFKAPIFRCHFD
jgi:hypothetical protein